MQLMTTPLPGMTPSGQLTTPFGATENQTLRESVKSKENVYRFDLLTPMQETWGPLVLKYRDKLYKLVSGTCTDIELRQYLIYFYLRSPAFSNFVTFKFYFDDPDIPFIRRIVTPARDMVKAQARIMINKVYTEGGKPLGIDMDYLYAVMPKGFVPVEGCELIA